MLIQKIATNKKNIFLSRSLSWKKIIECHAVMFRSHAALFWETLCWVSDPHLLPKNPVYTLQKTNMAMENLPFLAGDASSNGCLSFAVCHVCFWGLTLSRITVGNLLRQYRRGDYPEKGASCRGPKTSTRVGWFGIPIQDVEPLNDPK